MSRARVVEAHEEHVLQVRAGRERLGVDRAELLHRVADAFAAEVVEAERVLHALGAAGDAEGALGVVAQAGGMISDADRDGLGAAAADARHGERRDVVREPAAPAHALRAVDRVAVAVLRHAHHHVADERLVDRGVLERGLDGHAAELGGGEAREEARVLVVDRGCRRAAGAARAVEDDDAGGLCSMVVLSLLVQERRRNARAVLDEVLHADVHVDGAPGSGRSPPPRPPAPRASGIARPSAHHVDQDGVDGERAVAEVERAAASPAPPSGSGSTGRELHLAGEVPRRAPWPPPPGRRRARRWPSPRRTPPSRRAAGRCAAGRSARSRPMRRGSRWVPP